MKRLVPKVFSEIVDGKLCLFQNGDDEWSVDISEAAVKARSENLSEHISTLALTNDAELPSSQRLDKFFKFVDVREGFFCWCRQSTSQYNGVYCRISRSLVGSMHLEPTLARSSWRQRGWRCWTRPLGYWQRCSIQINSSQKSRSTGPS